MSLDTLKLLANTVRMLSADAVQKPNSGHPGLPMGAADFSVMLWAKHLRFNPSNTTWVNRDRFILSAGHGSMLLYSLLHLFEYDVSMEDIKSFRVLGSKTPGHPEFTDTPGVEATTGPLGQGFANGVGMALSQKMLAARYDKELFDHTIYGLVSDGDVMEGIAAEAASLAGHLQLDNLIYLYDDNKISLADPTDVCFTEDVPTRFESYGWFVQSVDGHDFEAVDAAIEKAKAASKPSIICCRTTIGFGSPNKAGTSGSHGSPLGEEELKLTKKNLGWPENESFHVPEEVRQYCARIVAEKKEESVKWEAAYAAWKEGNGDLAAAYENQAERMVPSELQDELLAVFADKKKDATRNLSHAALQVIAKHVPAFIGGSADLEPSTKTLIKNESDVQAPEYLGKNIRFGVREHAMGAACNGLAYTGHWIPYSATFLVFSDYLRPVMRLAALSHLQSLFIFTHDSFWVGEDGPTHQPIEHTQSLRLIPNLNVFRPADGEEVALCYMAALHAKDRPSAFILTRQGVPHLEKEGDVKDVLKGAYCVQGAANNDVVLLATGSEVALAVEAASLLANDGVSVKVVSMPCVELFLEQDASYQRALLPESATVISIECGVTSGWERFTGSKGLCIGRDAYGASGPGAELAEKFGFTGSQIAKRVKGHLGA